MKLVDTADLKSAAFVNSGRTGSIPVSGTSKAYSRILHWLLQKIVPQKSIEFRKITWLDSVIFLLYGECSAVNCSVVCPSNSCAYFVTDLPSVSLAAFVRMSINCSSALGMLAASSAESMRVRMVWALMGWPYVFCRHLARRADERIDICHFGDKQHSLRAINSLLPIPIKSRINE